MDKAQSKSEQDKAKEFRDIAGFDEETDRKYREWVKKVLGTPEGYKYHYPLIRGLKVGEHAEYVKENGMSLSPDLMRRAVLGGIEVKRKKGPVENLIKVGCECFGIVLMLRYYCQLLEKLGIDYGFLEKEYCCLNIPLYMELAAGRDRSEIDKTSREIQWSHVDEAHRRGAKNLVHFCTWCTIKNKYLFNDVDVKQLYCLDLLTDPKVWEGKKLKLNKTVGSYMGTSHRKGIYEPTGEITMEYEWKEYRKLLDRVEGLEVVDIPFYCCQVSVEPIWRFVKEHDLHTIVVGCPTCYGNLQRHTPEGVEVKSISQVLLEALE